MYNLDLELAPPLRLFNGVKYFLGVQPPKSELMCERNGFIEVVTGHQLHFYLILHSSFVFYNFNTFNYIL
jgi:hypothetical protein